MITNKDEAKVMTEHTSCDFKSKFNSATCNSKQKSNNKMCQCKCKKNRKSKELIVGILVHVLVRIVCI